MRTLFNRQIVAVISILGVALWVWPVIAAGAGVSIIPHRAAYELKLEQAVSGSNIVNVEGFMSYDWSRQCDGWTNDQRLFLAIQYPDKQTVKFKAVSVTWESGDGLRFRFKINREGMGQDDERIEGEATLEKLGGKGEILFDKPNKKRVRLPAGTLFPTQHTLLTLQKAIRGETFDRQVVFDGGDLKGAAAITTVFSAKRAEIKLPKAVKGYSPKPVYPMTLAFFPPESEGGHRDSLPQSELRIFYQADGIAPRIHLNYGDFKLRGDMIGFKKLPQPDC